MAFLKINEASLFIRETGHGEQAIVFSHGFLMDHNMFNAQVDGLGSRYRCLAYDHRGQGQSEVTEGGYDIESLTEDAAELIRELNAGPCHFVGLSMGGFVGLRLAIKYPELLASLTLIETSADPEPTLSRLKYQIMLAVARIFGFKPLIRILSGIMFGKTYNNNPECKPQREQWALKLGAAERSGLLKTAEGILNREGVYDQLDKISAPTLIIVGDEDTATPWVRAKRMQDGISGSELAVVEQAGHSSTLEQPAKVTAVISEFLARLH